MIRFVCCSVFLFCLVVGLARLPGDEPPNIVFILADDLGWNDVGYHNPKIRSPHLDRLARRGIQLECHYVQPQCTPTRVAALTGRYPGRFGNHCLAASNARALPPGTLTMADMLKSVGYQTALSGKWHLGSKPEWGPNHHGFDHSYGSLTGAVGMYDHRYRAGSPFEQTWHRNHEFVKEEGHATDLVTREAVRWIRDHHDQRFFLYVPFHAVHTPLVEEERFLDANRHFENPDRQLYAAAVTHLDECIGRIVTAIEEAGIGERTLIVFSSDNGAQINHSGGQYPEPDPALRNFSSNLPWRGRKTEVYEGGIRVPALVYWPGQLEPGQLTTPLHIVDWMPTLAGLTGFERDEGPDWDGHDIWPLLSGTGPGPASRVIYSVWGAQLQRQALRSGEWKIVRQRRKGQMPAWELYHLAEDPVEQHDLAEAMPDRLARLVQQFSEQRARDARHE